MVDRLARDEHVVAIGEIGIDLSGRSAPREAQETAFLAQLALARSLDLPVVVHVREAGPLVRALVDRAGGARGMIHCFSEGPDEVDEWMRRGFAVSFAGPVTYPKNDTLRLAAARASADRLLVETDAPYLAPAGASGEPERARIRPRDARRRGRRPARGARRAGPAGGRKCPETLRNPVGRNLNRRGGV